MINESIQRVETNEKLLNVVEGLLVKPTHLLTGFVAPQYVLNEKHTEGEAPVWKTEYLYYMKFWGGAFNCSPIIISYSHFHWMYIKDVESLIFRELLAKYSPYYFDHKTKKINKLVEVM